MDIDLFSQECSTRFAETIRACQAIERRTMCVAANFSRKLYRNLLSRTKSWRATSGPWIRSLYQRVVFQLRRLIPVLTELRHTGWILILRLIHAAKVAPGSAKQILKRVTGIAAAVHLLRQLKAYSPALPLLSQQIRDASADSSQRIETLSISFQDLAACAEESVGILTNLRSENRDQLLVSTTIQDCRQTVTQLLDEADRGNAQHLQTIARVEAVNQSVQQVFSLLREIEKTSFATKLFGLNARIEAVHLGESGRSLEVVADQISQHAMRSDELTEQVSEILKSIVANIGTAVKESNHLAELERQGTQAIRRSTGNVLRKLETASAEMDELLSTAHGKVEKLVAGISAATSSLQLQNGVSRRLEHVVESLDVMADALASKPVAGEEGQLLSDGRGEISESRSSNTEFPNTMDSEPQVQDVPVLVSAASASSGD